MEFSFQDLFFTFTTAFAALFPVVNPIGGGIMVNGLFNDLNEDERKTAAKMVFRNCLLIGLGSIVTGHLILLLFGLAVPVIQVGGGILICKTGVEWLSQNSAPARVSDETMRKLYVDGVENKLFYPISFPMCMGPGSISVIFTLMANAAVKGSFLQSGINYIVIAVVVLSMVAILYGILLQGKLLTRRLGSSGNMIINKLVAFITFCVGIQIFVTGIAKIFHLTIL